MVNFTLWPVYPQKENPVPTEDEAGSAQWAVWLLWSREQMSCHCQESNHDSSVVQTVASSLYRLSYLHIGGGIQNGCVVHTNGPQLAEFQVSQF